mgnify:CR=1 FL=1
MLLSIIRLLKPNILLPATTALGTVDPLGREKGILHGANVVMPNLSPVKHRKDYLLYDNKICTGDEAAQCIGCLADRMKKIGYEIVTDRGDIQRIMIRYDKNSLKAEEFINDGEILDSLKFADENKNNLELVDKIIEKARLKKGINHREASVL